MEVQKWMQFQRVLNGSSIYYKLNAIVAFLLPRVAQERFLGQKVLHPSANLLGGKNPVIVFLYVFIMHLAHLLVVLSIK